ncbi:hypothetical protein CN205_14745 [Sinorhizobium meliloti]|nr:hypothetical protein CN205_14745 [Sinorhizobium meliloti]
METTGKVGGRMTIMAVETTAPLLSSRYPNRPEICQSQKRASFRNIPANTAFERRSSFQEVVFSL